MNCWTATAAAATIAAVDSDQPSGRRFGEAVSAYERGRPSYPEDAVRWLLPDAARLVLDAGAGTGKLTRALTPLVPAVVAVEPDVGMAAAARAALPSVPVVAGVAEHLPLRDASADAVLVGQAWHWVEPLPASREAARVLRPGGVLGLAWNDRDERDPWVAALSDLLRPHARSRDEGPPVVGLPFGALGSASFAWSMTMTPDDVVAMVTSRSYAIALDGAQRDRLAARVRQHALDAVDAGSGRVAVPYVTRAYRAVRP
jgi:SAM-dependent methyltransferase